MMPVLGLYIYTRPLGKPSAVWQWQETTFNTRRARYVHETRSQNGQEVCVLVGFPSDQMPQVIEAAYMPRLEATNLWRADDRAPAAEGEPS